MVYEWKPGSRIRAKADQAAEVFETLERRGELTPDRLVEVSRPKNAPLHGEFEWNDPKAAEEYRIIQARHLIMCLVVKDETVEENAEPVRAYFPVENDCTFTHITRIFSDDDLHAILLDKAKKELEQMQKKYRNLLEFKNVNVAITDFIQKTEKGRAQNAAAPL